MTEVVDEMGASGVGGLHEIKAKRHPARHNVFGLALNIPHLLYNFLQDKLYFEVSQPIIGMKYYA